MKQFLIVGVVLFCTGILKAQHFGLILFNQAYVSCETTYDDLERLPLGGRGKADKFTKDGVPFTGVAKDLLTDYDGKVIEFLVAEMKEGFPTKVSHYFPDGELSREFNFKDGKSHGLHIMYHNNGQKYIEEYYEDGKMHGAFKRWTEEGKLARDAMFQHGIPVFDKVYIKDDKC